MIFLMKFARPLGAFTSYFGVYKLVTHDDKMNEEEQKQIWSDKYVIRSPLAFPASYNNQFECSTPLTSEWVVNLVEALYIDDTSSSQILSTSQGTKLCSEIPVIKLYFQLEGDIETLFNALFIPEERLRWDRNTLKYDIVSDDDNLQTYYMVNKSIPLFKNRDYYEKRMLFYSNDKIYFYSSALPNQDYQHTSKNVRGTTVVNAGMIKKTKNGVEYFICSQVDAKMPFSIKNFSRQLKGSSKEIYKSLNSYLSLVANKPKEVQEIIKA